MLRCPFCDADLGAASSRLRGGRCPECGSMLDWTEEPVPAAAAVAARSAAGPSSADEDAMSIRDIVRTIVSRSPGVRPPLVHGPSEHYEPSLDEPSLDDLAPAAPAVPAASLLAASSAPPPAAPAVDPPQPPDDGGGADGDAANPDLDQLWRKAATVVSRPSMTLKASSVSPEATITDLFIRPFQIAPLGQEQSYGNEFELQEVIGEGGVGVVYAARQGSLDRVVALKMLRGEFAHQSDHRNKFLSEAVVTGELDHPNIVPIYDLGTSDQGTLFYAMKRVRGTPWSQVIAQQSLAENLRVLMSVADAIAFAHSRGVVHRDLKPENVMLGDFGEVLVMDWGIALSTGLFLKSDRISQTSSMGGTPAYMAPEMATGPLKAIGPASDVYLLGAILYEIVTGRPPHTGQDVMACLYAAARNEIQPTDKTGELLDIAITAMATRPLDRYASVQDFQSAIREYQSHSESIVLSTRADQELAEARRTSDYQDYSRALFAYQEAFSLWSGNERAAEGENETRLAYAECALAKEDFDLGISLLDERRADHAGLRRKLTTARAERDARQARIRGLRQLAIALAASVILSLSGGLFFIGRQYSEIQQLSESRLQTIGDLERTKKNLDSEKKNLQTTNSRLENTTAKLSKSNEDLLITRQAALREADTARRAEESAAAASYRAQIGVAAEQIANNSFNDAERLLDHYQKPDVRWMYFRHWEWGHLKYLCARDAAPPVAAGSRIESLAAAADGSRVAAGTASGKALVWAFDRQTLALKPLAELPHRGPVVAIALSPDGRRLAVAGEFDRGRISLYRQTADGERYEKEPRELPGHERGVLSLAFSPARDQLASSSHEGPVRLWNLASGEVAASFSEHFGPVWSLAFLPDGRRVVTAGADATVRIWDADAGTSRVYRGHQEPVYCVAASPQGDWIASAGRDRAIHVWRSDKDLRIDYEAIARDLERQRRGKTDAAERPTFHLPDRKLEGHSADVRALAFSPDGRKLLSGGNDNTVRLWNFLGNAAAYDFVTTLRGHGGWVRGCVLAGDARHAISGSLDGFVKVWDGEEYEEVRALRGHEDAVLWAAFSADGQRMVTAARDRRALLWSAGSRQPLQVFDEGESLLPGGGAGGLAARLREGHAFLATSAVFFPDGQRLLTSAGDGTVRMWDVAGGGQLRRFSGTGTLGVLGLSPDGQWVATGSVPSEQRDDQAALLWAAGDERAPPIRLGGHRAEVCAIAFSPHLDPAETRIATGDLTGTLRLWRLDPAEGWQSYARLAGHERGHGITAIRFTPDGTRVLSASYDRTVMIYDAASGQRLTPILRHPDGVKGLALSADGSRALTFCSTGREEYRVSLWNLDTGAERSCTISRRNEALTSVDFQPNQRGAILTTTSGDASWMWRWDLVSPQPQPLWSGRELRGTVWSTTWSPDGRRIVAVGGSQARLLTADDGKVEKTFSSHGAVTSANFSPSGGLIVTSGEDGDVKIWHADPDHPQFGRVALKLAHPHATGEVWYPVNFASFSPAHPDEAAMIVTAGSDGAAQLWQLAGGNATRLHILGGPHGHSGSVHSAVFSPDGELVLTASADRTARLWRVATGGPVEGGGVLDHPERVLFAAFSPDGRLAITGCDDNGAYVWDVSDPAAPGQVRHLQGHTAAVTCAAISADGRRAITGSQDGIAKLWDLESGEEVLSLKRHTAELTSVHFSPDGGRILTSSRDQTALVWPGIKIGPAIKLSSMRLTIGRDPGLHPIDPEAQVFDPDAGELEGGLLEVWLEGNNRSGRNGSAAPVTLEMVAASDLAIEGDEVSLIGANGQRVVALLRDAPQRAGAIELEILAGATTLDAQRLLRAVGARIAAALDDPLDVRARITDGNGLASSIAEATLQSEDASADTALAAAE